MWKCEQRKKFILRYFTPAANRPCRLTRELSFFAMAHQTHSDTLPQGKAPPPALFLCPAQAEPARRSPAGSRGSAAPATARPAAASRGGNGAPGLAMRGGAGSRAGAGAARSPSQRGRSTRRPLAPGPASPRSSTSQGVRAARRPPPPPKLLPTSRPAQRSPLCGSLPAGEGAGRGQPRTVPAAPLPLSSPATSAPRRCLPAPCGPRRPPPPDSSAALAGRPSGTRFCGTRLERRQPSHPCPAPPWKDEPRNRAAGEGRNTTTSCSSRWPEVGGTPHLRRVRSCTTGAAENRVPVQGRGQFRVRRSFPPERLLRNFGKLLPGLSYGDGKEDSQTPREHAVLCCPRNSGWPGQVPRCPPAPLVPRSAQGRPQRLGDCCPSRRRPGCRPRTAPAGLGSRLPTSAELGWASRR